MSNSVVADSDGGWGWMTMEPSGLTYEVWLKWSDSLPSGLAQKIVRAIEDVIDEEYSR